MVANTSAAQRAALTPNRRAAKAWTSASTPSMAAKAGRRRLNSDRPSSLMDSAGAQNASGGLPQKGTPGSNQGVTQSPVTAIRRAISA